MPLDLPVEIWLEILSYLPQSFLYKLMGLNRVLFNLAMKHKYEEVRFMTDDKSQLKTFEKLRDNTSTASFVRRLYLRPAFLAGQGQEKATQRSEDGDADTSRKRSFWSSSLAKLSGRSSMRELQDGPGAIVPDPLPATKLKLKASGSPLAVLTVAAETLSKCPHLDDVTIVVYDRVLTPEFWTFLHTLWGSMGARIQKVTVSTTFNETPTLLEALAHRTDRLVALKHLDITVVPSRFIPQDLTVLRETNAIVNLVHGLQESLTHLTLSASSTSSALEPRLLFEGLGTLPSLQSLEIWCSFCEDTSPEGGSGITKFLAANAATLQQIKLRSRPKVQPIDTSRSRADALRYWTHHDLPSICLPELRALDIELPQNSSCPSKPFSNTEGVLLPPLLPSLFQLDTLTLAHANLTYQELEEVLDKTGPQLKGLDCCVWRFNPATLALLVAKAPALTRLSNAYVELSKEPDRVASLGGSLPPIAVRNERGTRVWEYVPPVDSKYAMYLALEEVRWPEWPLRRIRIGTKGQCGLVHPVPYLGKVMKKVFSAQVVVDGKFECACAR